MKCKKEREGKKIMRGRRGTKKGMKYKEESEGRKRKVRENRGEGRKADDMQKRKVGKKKMIGRRGMKKVMT